MLADELPVARQHAAEVLRPRAVCDTINDHAADLARTQFLRLGGEAEERVDLSLGEKLLWRDRWTCDSVDVLDRIKPNMGGHGCQEDVWGSTQALHPHLLALQIRDTANAFVSE
jgi:hypothetical protein